MQKTIFFSLFFFFLITDTSAASAQTSCLKYPSGSTPPSGVSGGKPWAYGASWDVFDSAKPLLIKASCPESGNSITLTIGKGTAAQYIWGKAFTYNAGTWTEHVLTGTDGGDGWLLGSGTKTVTAPATTSSESPFFFVGYVCTNRSGSWKCGCSNASCTSSNWQMQAFTGVPSTGGGGDGDWTGNGFTPPAFYKEVKNNAAKICYTPSNTRSLAPNANAISESGTAANPLVYVPSGAFSGGTLTISASNVVVKGGTFNGTLVRITGSNVRVTQNTFRSTGGGKMIDISIGSRFVRIDRNILDAMNSGDTVEDIQVNIRDGENTPRYHRIDHNLFTGAVGGGLNIYLGLVNKANESISRTLVERNYVDHSGRQYGFYLKSMENVIENNVIDGGGSRSGPRTGGRNIYFQNHFKGNTGAMLLDTDNYFVSNVSEGTKIGLWIGSGDCTFSAHDCEAGAGQANHPQSVNSKVWGNKFIGGDDIRVGALEFKLEGGQAQRCPIGTDLAGNSKTALGEDGCTAPANQSVNASVNPPLIGLTKAMVGPTGVADTLCQ